MPGPEDRLRALLSLARRVPDAWLNINLSWENEHGRAGINTSDDGAVVYLNNAEEDVADLAEAETLIRQILADEIVSVTGYDGEEFAFCRLVPADSISAAIPAPSHPGHGHSKIATSLVIETWSRGMIRENE